MNTVGIRYNACICVLGATFAISIATAIGHFGGTGKQQVIGHLVTGGARCARSAIVVLVGGGALARA
jgi:hypothetical protein